MFQYFNYNFNEETFKIYIDQQFQKFSDLNSYNHSTNEKIDNMNTQTHKSELKNEEKSQDFENR